MLDRAVNSLSVFVIASYYWSHFFYINSHYSTHYTAEKSLKRVSLSTYPPEEWAMRIVPPRGLRAIRDPEMDIYGEIQCVL